MPLHDMLRERVALLKQDGQRLENIRAYVQGNLIVTDNAKLPIEEGDVFERRLPNGMVETYVITDRGFMEGTTSFPSYYQSKVRRQSKARSEAGSGSTASSSTLKLFISHSSRDVALVRLLLDLLRTSLRLSATQIRCTSVDGYRLPGGADTMDRLRSEVHDAEAFIGVISRASLDSLYVAFELGARWGARKHLLPLLAPGVDTTALTGPLSGINALRSDSAAQLHQLIDDLANHLQLTVEPPSVFHVKIDEILRYVPPQDPVPQAALDEVRLDAAKELMRFLAKILNREAPEAIKNKHGELRQEWAVLNRHLYLLQAPEELRERLDERIVTYLRSLRDLTGDPAHRPEVERQRDLGKRQARQLLHSLGLTADWS